MNAKDTVFPQYRKLSNNRTFYKILDDRHFEEIQLFGSKKNKYLFTATQYPEILKIQDMLMLAEGTYVNSSKEEWDKLDLI